MADDADAAEALAGQCAQVAEEFVEGHGDLDHGDAGYALGPFGEASARDDDFGVRIFPDVPFDAGVVGVLDLDLDAQFAGHVRRGVGDALHRAEQQDGLHGAVSSMACERR